jgi:cytochrome P450
MRALSQSPRDPAFVQDPYPFYDRARSLGPLFLWEDYGFPCAAGHAEVSLLLRDRRFGRELPEALRPARPAHLADFYRLDDRSMLDREPPAHTRLRGLVLRAFTSRRIAALAPDITAIAAEAEGSRLDTDELVATCVLLLNAGHEATVHAIGNGVAAILGAGLDPTPLFATPEATAAAVEEILRFDPPLHLFTRHALADVELLGHRFRPGDTVGCLLAAANRDPARFPDPARFDPARPPGPHLSFGAGIHFCVGAPLARAELALALPLLFRRRPGLALAAPPAFADRYHFHGLTELRLTSG